MAERDGFGIKETLKFGSLLTITGLMGFGLSFLANPDLLARFLRSELKAPFLDMVRNGSEKDRLELIMQCIPDGEEQLIAQQINYACDGRRRRKVKPHIAIFTALTAIAVRYKYYPRLDDD